MTNPKCKCGETQKWHTARPWLAHAFEPEPTFKPGDMVVCMHANHKGQVGKVRSATDVQALVQFAGGIQLAQCAWYGNEDLAPVRHTDVSESNGQADQADARPAVSEQALEMARAHYSMPLLESMAAGFQKLMDEAAQKDRDAQRTIATLENALSDMSQHIGAKPQCRDCGSDKPLLPCIDGRAHDFPQTVSEEALEMAGGLVPREFGRMREEIAAALQKLMDERDKWAGYTRHYEARIDEYQKRAEAAEKEVERLGKFDWTPPKEPSVEAIQAAHKLFPHEFDDRRNRVAAALQKLMDERDLTAANMARRTDYWQRRAEAAEMERDGWIEKFDRVNDERGETLLRAEAAEAELHQQMEWAKSTYAEMRQRAEAAEKEAAVWLDKAHRECRRAEAAEKERDGYADRNGTLAVRLDAAQQRTEAAEQARKDAQEWAAHLNRRADLHMRAAKRWKALAKNIRNRESWAARRVVK